MSTVAAIATPNAPGGIGVIRISGENAIEIADRVFVSPSGKKLSSLKGYTAAYGSVCQGDETIDECVALIFRAPKSYTGEDVAEISCHGGLYVTQRVLRAVLGAGAQAAPAGEFTKRAFLNGKIDLAEAEAVMNIISSGGQQALSSAINTLEGKLSEKIRAIAKKLITVSAAIAVWTDDPDEDVPLAHQDNVEKTAREALEKLQKLIRDYDNGRAITGGIDAVICGHPNVGKSTLMNLLSGRERSIVTPIAGTTRDIVEETVNLGNIILRLSDTAGIRSSEDLAESIGIEMARKKLDNAQLILAVFDYSQPLTAADRELLEKCRGRRAVAVINKTDLEKELDIEEVKRYIPITAELSAAKGEGVEVLSEILEKLLGTDEIDSSSGMLASERQRSCCESACAALLEAAEGLAAGVTLDAANAAIDSAIESLLALTGERARDVVVDEVFSKFCVGK